MIEAAIVGLGRWGRRLVESTQENGRPLDEAIRFRRAVVRRRDPDVDAFAAAERLEVTLDLDEALADDRINAVVIATPPDQHTLQIVAAARAGKHVFVEKPLALELHDAQSAVAASVRANVVLAVGQQFRFLPAYQRLRDLVAAGALGELVHVEGNLSTGQIHYWEATHWRSDPAQNPAGPITVYGQHLVDLMVDLVGPVAAISTRTARLATSLPIDDVATATMQFRAGPTGQLSSVISTLPHFRLAAFGTLGWAQIEHRERLEMSRPDGPPTIDVLPAGELEREELCSFAAAAMGAGSYPVSLGSALHTVAVLIGAARSVADGGAPASVEDVD